MSISSSSSRQSSQLSNTSGMHSRNIGSSTTTTTTGGGAQRWGWGSISSRQATPAAHGTILAIAGLGWRRHVAAPAALDGVMHQRFTAGGSVRCLSSEAKGFKLDDIGNKNWRARNDLTPAPRLLSEVVKLPLLKREDSATVRVGSACRCCVSCLHIMCASLMIAHDSAFFLSWHLGRNH
jgi:hypothetical protein